MEKLNAIIAQTRITCNTATTPLPPPQPDPGRAARQQQALDQLVDDAAAWLTSRWPGQINRLPAAARAAALDGWREVLTEMTPAEVERARAAWRAPYPPDPAAFLAAGERADGAEQFHSAAAAAGCQPAAWHRLPARTYAAAQALAERGINLREASWGDGNSAAARAWLSAYRQACRLDDLNQLPPPPPPPAGALPHRRDQAAAERGCSAMRAILRGEIPPPPPPPPPPEWLARMAALGVSPKA